MCPGMPQNSHTQQVDAIHPHPSSGGVGCNPHHAVHASLPQLPATTLMPQYPPSSLWHSCALGCHRIHTQSRWMPSIHTPVQVEWAVSYTMLSMPPPLSSQPLHSCHSTQLAPPGTHVPWGATEFTHRAGGCHPSTPQFRWSGLYPTPRCPCLPPSAPSHDTHATAPP